MKERKQKKHREFRISPDSIYEKYGDGRFFEDSRRLTAAEREMLRYQGGDESQWSRN